ncbi:MAG TPA: hypothetical protein VNO51_25245 [Ilumatobacteraceae bacterium]|nr:hypothetical protein [Ilumatobacteraceae bacterium]
MTFNLGMIDANLLAGDSLELVIVVPTQSVHHVWLAYDTAPTPSSIRLTLT